MKVKLLCWGYPQVTGRAAVKSGWCSDARASPGLFFLKTLMCLGV
jgi:hypothetical protein